MLKIKDSLLNEDEIIYIRPFNSRLYGYCIRIELKNDKYLCIDFNTELERDKELNRILKKVEEE
jgi:hypothetical protein